uniref:Pyrroline-5-carboxylate reductase n=1 Tax=Odontella aurita TaxID=265563 RepID=A0A7S4J3C9_9STRA|mmetsp:Transcript_37341/g.111864  ORF Transcript_37341/g.111864 Transcript_37341/m.111864 type:complete len:274 (+) Transcript_37341:105-926(+)
MSNFGFIGAGMMASALMQGLVSNKVVDPSNISCSDPYEPSRKKASEQGFFATESNKEVCERAKDVVILAVKPNVVEAACSSVAAVESDALVVSILAGVTLKTLEDLLPGRRVVRVMPNTPCLVGEAASGFALGKLATPSDKGTVEKIFGSVGVAVEVTETNLDAVTGLSGSGPAYVFQFIEALADGGVRCGLTRPVAMQLAAQTVKGAAEMVLSTGKHPGQLKDGVTSPGGTTIAGECDRWMGPPLAFFLAVWVQANLTIFSCYCAIRRGRGA